ncbi:MBL fold metallo-hydrolase [Marinobacter sp. HL-58]|uniref:MBL fold metallo-hydrolase n=1 Tax=Marinobacter sp. HL-58 TaxID=1479237 RepID=UPI000AE1CEFB|nr:MBL fold metallo-hydrolase [Marinobacter sp. HL-58]
MIRTIFVLFVLACATALPVAVSAENLTAHEMAARGLEHAEDFPGLISICNIDEPIRDAAEKRSEGEKKQDRSGRRSEHLAPTQVFDNLYYVGTGGVASWVLETSEGLIIIDALNNNAEAEKYIVDGLETLGLDPNELQYLVITHGHGDHYGGQELLVSRYQPKVVMSDIEWTILEQPVLDFSSPRWGERPKRDISINDGDTITLGETTVQLHVTPGHTPGTVSLIFPVYDNGERHMAALWGGTGLNYGPVEDRIQSYSEAAERFRQEAKAANVDVFISNHPTRDGSAKRIKALAERQQGEKHPFVIGNGTALGALEMLRDCTQAQVLRIREGNE